MLIIAGCSNDQLDVDRVRVDPFGYNESPGKTFVINSYHIRAMHHYSTYTRITMDDGGWYDVLESPSVIMDRIKEGEFIAINQK